MRVLIDLDGVLWNGDDAIAGAAAALEQLSSARCELWAVTNNAAPMLAQYVEKFARLGFGAAIAPQRLITSAQAAASLLVAGQEVVVCGAAGLQEAVQEVGAVLRPQGPVDAVVVGLDPDFNDARLAVATRAVLGGAVLIAANADPTYPTADGPAPGAGSILAAVVAATGASPVIAGKPHVPMVELVRSRVELTADDWMVGDRRSTDGVFARALGVRFALVSSSVSETPTADVAGSTVVEGESLAEIVETILESARR